MNRPFRSPSAVKQSAAQGRVVIQNPFDYTPLATEAAQQVQTAAQRIRVLMQRTLADAIAVGQELLAVKETLPHGQFGIWLRAEFDWTQRTAGRFMAAAQRFGNKMDTMSILKFDLTAAYLLAAPSTPQEACAQALRRAENGERITTSVAKEILGSYRSLARREKASTSEWPEGKLLGRLLEVLEFFRQHWDSQQLDAWASELRDYADSLQE